MNTIITKRGRHWLFIRKPQGAKWSRVGISSDVGYFAPNIRTEQQALALIDEVAAKYQARGYITEVRLEHWEVLS